jgi:hypothetical protein
MEDFAEIVQRAWGIECLDVDPVSIWQCKIRNVRKKVKGWSRNREAEIRKNKQDLILELDGLYALAETLGLSDEDADRRKDLSLKLDRIWKLEETKAWQRSRDRDIKEVDKNNSYFFAKASQRKRKKFISWMKVMWNSRIVRGC